MENLASVTRAGAVPTLLSLLTGTDSPVEHHVVATLNNLANDAGARTEIREGGGVEIVAPLAAAMAPSWLKTQALEMLQRMGVEGTEGALSNKPMSRPGAESSSLAGGRRGSVAHGNMSARPVMKFHGQAGASARAGAASRQASAR